MKNHNSINKLPNGAKFYRVDLHIHTPISSDYEDKSVTLEQILDKCVEEGLDLVAITDHNIVGDLEELDRLATAKNVTVLPGVEISTRGGKQGIHLLAIFDRGTRKDILLDLLSRVGITSEKRGKEEALTDCFLTDVLEEIRKLGGITIAAHSDSRRGLTEDMRGQQRAEIINDERLNAIEIIHKDTRKYFDRTDGSYKRRVPCIQSSDAHSLDEIGKRVTRLKMDALCLEGIRQAFIDQESRIRFDDEEALKSYPTIEGILIDGGFLDKQTIHFNKNLNCFIGGRGVGKSTLIELIRFCLSVSPEMEFFKQRHFEMVEKLLAGGKVSLIIRTSENSIYNIQRKSGESSEVYSDDDNIVDININTFFPIVCFGETEIEKISYDVAAQMALIDRFTEGLDELILRENELYNKLDNNLNDIVVEKRVIEESNERLSELPTLKETIKTLNKYDFDTKLNRQRMRIEERGFITKLCSLFEDLESSIISLNINEILDQFEKELPDTGTISQYPNKTIILKAINAFKRSKTHILQNRQKEDKHLKNTIKKIETLKANLEERHSRQKQRIVKLYEQLKSKDEEEAARKYVTLQEELQTLSALESSTRRRKIKVNRLLRKRQRLLKHLNEIRDKLYKKRRDCAEILSKELGAKINITLIKGGVKEKYFESLEKHLKGSRVRKTDIRKIVGNITPFEFFDIIEQKNKDELMNKAKISESWADSVIHFANLRENIYRIQQVKLPDLPQITLKVGEKEKNVADLSLGQRCTTLLSLIMIESTHPLIIDTPEQGLDNMFIYDSVVKNLRAIKERRQVILATHNANIPVSGDAEQIICLESDGRNGWVACNGSIDDNKMKINVQNVLEGGKEAFEIRKRKYGY